LEKKMLLRGSRYAPKVEITAEESSGFEGTIFGLF